MEMKRRWNESTREEERSVCNYHSQGKKITIPFRFFGKKKKTEKVKNRKKKESLISIL